MDADGEDTPEGTVTLVRSFTDATCSTAVFARRARRSESYLFRSLYHTYRFVHWSLTGIGVRVGNFSILPMRYLDTLVAMPELWNHYAAAVFRSKLPFTMTPIARGTRIAGRSGMNFVSLVSHGLSAMAVFGDVVGVRFLVGSLIGSLIGAVLLVAVVIIRFTTALAVPGWATYAAGLLIVIIIQLVTTALSFSFFMLANRTNLGFVPLRDFSLFLDKVITLYPYE